MRVLVIDAANVVGSRADGWWRDRPGAARKLHEALLTADLPYDEIVFVLEGQAKAATKAGRDGHVLTVHAPKDGDTDIIKATQTAIERGNNVVAITADGSLRTRLENLGARVMSPGWLLDAIDNPSVR